MKAAPTLALAMIVRDEEPIISRCLRSVLGVVDEVIIVDTGSIDSTKEIIASFRQDWPGVTGADGEVGPGLRLLESKWSDDFSAARNLALDHASADWVLQLDADEELLPSDTLASLICDSEEHTVPGEVPIYAYEVRVLIPSTWRDVGGLEPLWLESAPIIRLFRRNACRYVFPVHEQIELQKNGRVVTCSLEISHFGGAADYPSDRSGRYERNLRILKRVASMNPTDGYYSIKLAEAYSSLGMDAQAVEEYQKGIGLLVDADPTKPFALRNLAQMLFAAGDRQNAVHLLLNGMKRFPSYTDFAYLLGDALLRAGQPLKARQMLERCLAMGDAPSEYEHIEGAGTWRALELISKIDESTSDL